MRSVDAAGRILFSGDLRGFLYTRFLHLFSRGKEVSDLRKEVIQTHTKETMQIEDQERENTAAFTRFLTTPQTHEHTFCIHFAQEIRMIPPFSRGF